MDVSVVVATYNRAEHLGRCLASLAGQRRLGSARVEVIVCDDGSRDGTFDVVRGFTASLDIRYCYQPDRGFRLAESRNMGLKLMRGECAVFLDADVVASPYLIAEYLRAHRALAPGPYVAVGPVLGYCARGSDEHMVRVAEKGDWWADPLDADPSLRDIRHGVWREHDFTLSRMREPWSMVIGANFSTSAEAARSVSGFDDEMVGWGGEDTDFAFRLHRAGAAFELRAGAAVLHLPHDQDEEGERVGQVWNKFRIHDNCPGVEAELIPFYRVLDLERHIAGFKRLVRQPLSPSYVPDWGERAEEFLRGRVARPCKVVGCGDNAALAESVRASLVYEPDEHRAAALRERLSGVRVVHCIGAGSQAARDTVATSVVTDFWRFLDPQVAVAVIARAVESSEVCLLLDSGTEAVASRSPMSTAELGRLLNRPEFALLAGPYHYTLEPEFRCADGTVFRAKRTPVPAAPPRP